MAITKENNQKLLSLIKEVLFPDGYLAIVRPIVMDGSACGVKMDDQGLVAYSYNANGDEVVHAKVLLTLDDPKEEPSKDLGDWPLIFMTIEYKKGISRGDAILRARSLIPCKTGEADFENVEYDGNQVLVNVYVPCEPGYYEENPDGAEYGPDDTGVKVKWSVGL